MSIPIIGKPLPPPLLLIRCNRCLRSVFAKIEKARTDLDYRPAAARLLHKIGCNCAKFEEPIFMIVDLPYITSAGPMGIYNLIASTCAVLGGEEIKNEKEISENVSPVLDS
jgi:hypothetical protein